MDAQGWPRASPFVKKAGLSFPSVVDRAGLLWEAWDFQVVPLQFLFDETGRLMASFKGKPDAELLAQLDAALAAPPVRTPDSGSVSSPRSGKGLFARGLAALDAGKPKKARRLWERALAQEPENWLIRKQIWALEAPDRFYAGDIDFAWQRERVAAEAGGD